MLDYSVAPGTFANVARYYLLVFGIAWVVWIPLGLSSRLMLAIQLPGSLAWLAGVAPVFAGSLLLYRESGWQGLQQLLTRIGMWKFGLRWYGIAFGLPVVIILLDLGAYHLVGGQIQAYPRQSGRSATCYPSSS